MKRFLLILPMFLLILLNACNGNSIPYTIGTAVGQTQTAAIWTATITYTPNPNEAGIVTWLNTELSAVDPLQVTLDARFQVLDVQFLPSYGTAYQLLQVEMSCDCTRNMQCCTPERMFVLVMLAMKKHRDDMLREVPNDVSEVNVVCYDRVTRIGVMVAWWVDVKDYLRDRLTGDQLAYRVQRNP